jgi:hypothetical protein
MLEGWADPKTKLPNEGAQPPFPEDWATAQSALRYLGWTKDPSRGWQILEKQLHRRNKKLDVSWDSLMQGGLTIVGMTLRALGVGASDGFAQWGDPKAYDELVKYAEDPMENEQGRMEACFAIAWVATSRPSSASRCPTRRPGSSTCSRPRCPTWRSATRSRAPSAWAASRAT